MACCDLRATDFTSAVRERARHMPYMLLRGVAALWTVMLVLDACRLVGESRWISCCIAGVEIACLWLLASRPLVGVVPVAILWCMSLVSPIPVPPAFGYVGLTAVGVLGYLGMPLSILFASVFMAVNYVSHLLMADFVAPLAIMPALTMCADMLLAGIVGCIVRIVRRNMRERDRWRVQQQHMAVAARLHDEACNDLVYALLTLRRSQVETASTNDDEEHERLAQVSAAVEDALASVRSGILLLRASDDGDEHRTERRRTLPVHAAIEWQHSRVRELGFDGLTSVSDGARFVTSGADRIAALDGLIRELFGNLVKYADAAHPFVCSVDVQGDMLYLSWCNTRAARPNVTASSGSGISGCRRLFEQCGGALAAGAGDGALWCVEASMPLHGASTMPD